MASAGLGGRGGTDKDKEPADQNVDAGSFGVFMNGRRVATEKFSIQQSTAGSVATSEFKTEAGADKAAQSSELQLAPERRLAEIRVERNQPGKSASGDYAQRQPAGRTLHQQSAGQRGGASIPASRFNQCSGRLLLYPSRNSGLEVSGHGLPPGQGTWSHVRRTSR